MRRIILKDEIILFICPWTKWFLVRPKTTGTKLFRNENIGYSTGYIFANKRVFENTIYSSFESSGVKARSFNDRTDIKVTWFLVRQSKSFIFSAGSYPFSSTTRCPQMCIIQENHHYRNMFAWLEQRRTFRVSSCYRPIATQNNDLKCSSLLTGLALWYL